MPSHAECVFVPESSVVEDLPSGLDFREVFYKSVLPLNFFWSVWNDDPAAAPQGVRPCGGNRGGMYVCQMLQILRRWSSDHRIGSPIPESFLDTPSGTSAGVAELNEYRNGPISLKGAKFYAAHAQPSPLLLVEVVYGGLQRLCGTGLGRLSGQLGSICLCLQASYSVTYALVNSCSAVSETPRCRDVLLRSISTNASGSDQLISLERTGFGVVPVDYRDAQNRRGYSKLYDSVGLLFPDALPWGADAVLFFILGQGCVFSLYGALAFCRGDVCKEQHFYSLRQFACGY